MFYGLLFTVYNITIRLIVNIIPFMVACNWIRNLLWSDFSFDVRKWNLCNCILHQSYQYRKFSMVNCVFYFHLFVTKQLQKMLVNLQEFHKLSKAFPRWAWIESKYKSWFIWNLVSSSPCIRFFGDIWLFQLQFTIKFIIRFRGSENNFEETQKYE